MLISNDTTDFTPFGGSYEQHRDLGDETTTTEQLLRERIYPCICGGALWSLTHEGLTMWVCEACYLTYVYEQK